jgi:hypothetical protein
MRHRRGRARAAWLLVVPTAAVLLGGLAAAPVHADPRDNPGGWQSYLEQPATSNVRAVSATVLSGSVSNARGLTPDGHGDTTLTVASANNPATVLLDYGVGVEGVPYLDVESYSGTAPAASLAFTEAKTYLRTPGSGTLAAASAAGATAISVQPGTPRSPLTFAAGDTVTIGSPTETDTIVSVSGATLTLKAPLADAHPAGATVTSTPGAITGDSAFQPRQVSLTVTAKGTLTSGLMGGFRFEAITLITPGTLVLRGAGVQFGDGYLAKASDYQGYFLSSSRTFNTMYYDGAYTEQTDMQPAGTSGATQPSVLDGAKRDRAIWSGDLKIEGQGIADTLGSNGDNYVKQSLLTLITSSKQGGGLNADTLFRTGPYSNSYSSWTLDAATTYYRNTGDTAFAQQILPWLEGQLAYDATLTNSDGLIVTGPQISTTDPRPVDQGRSPLLADGRGTGPDHGLHRVAGRAPRHAGRRSARDRAHNHRLTSGPWELRWVGTDPPDLLLQIAERDSMDESVRDGQRNREDLIGALLAAECRRKDADVLLAPPPSLVGDGAGSGPRGCGWPGSRRRRRCAARCQSLLAGLGWFVPRRYSDTRRKLREAA